MRVTDSGRSSRCAPPHIVLSACSVPCSSPSEIDGLSEALAVVVQYLIGVSRRFVPPAMSCDRSRSRLPAGVSAHHSASSHRITPVLPGHRGGTQPGRSWGGERRKGGKKRRDSQRQQGNVAETLAPPTGETRASTSQGPPMYPITPIPLSHPNVALRCISSYAPTSALDNAPAAPSAPPILRGRTPLSAAAPPPSRRRTPFTPNPRLSAWRQ